MLKGITYISASGKRNVKRTAKAQGRTKTFRKAKPTSFGKQRYRYAGNRYEGGRLWLLFFAGIIAGTFFANLFFRDGYAEMGIYSEYFMDKFSLMEVKNKELFLYAFESRLKEILVVCLLSLTSFGALIPGAYLVYKGFCVGILVSIYVMQYGTGGIFLYLLSVFPHYLAYVPMAIMLVHVGFEIHSDIKQFKSQKKYPDTKKMYAYGKVLIILLFLNVIASYLETFANLPLMTKVLQ